MFNEDNTIEQMVLATLQANGWKYIEAEKLPRHYSDVMVESMVRDALIRLRSQKIRQGLILSFTSCAL